jgi:threonine synthase
MMRLYNIQNKNEVVSFREAALKGIGSAGGLFFPEHLPYFEDIHALLSQDFMSRSIAIAKALWRDELSEEALTRIIKKSFNFPIALKAITEKISALELFHGPTLAFKDFGARFMAQVLLEFNREKSNGQRTTILTATSGDTGAAVAHAFYGLENIQVVILYPYQRISELQEKMFTTLGGNIHTLTVKSDFDTCQAMVKQCFSNQALVNSLGLNSANSINISRLLAQIFYYFEAVAQSSQTNNLVVSVPCGNFGNLTAGLLAQQMGLPIKSFVAATNVNDTVPHYLRTAKWEVKTTKSTLANAMDVSNPNNWPRIEELYKNSKKSLSKDLRSIALTDQDTISAMQKLDKLDYVADPHSAIAYSGLETCLQEGEHGIFLCTAHPAKFKSTVEGILKKEIILPLALENVAQKPILSSVVSSEAEVQAYLRRLV